jgi:deoxyadenosine/deoxycytidine kinase
LASLEKDLKNNDSKTLKRIQSNLKELIKYNQTIIVEIEPSALKEYKQILSDLSVEPSKKVISDFIVVQGSSNKTKARCLLKEVETLLTNSQLANRDYYLKIQTVLMRFINGKTKYIETPDLTLSGIAGIGDVEVKPNAFKSGKPVPLTNFVKTSFVVIPFTGKWLKLIGNPQLPMKIMMYGNPGGGKSSLAMMLAYYLASEHGQKVLIVSKEEGFNFTVKEKAKRLNCIHENIHIVDTLPTNISGYDLIILDSVNSLRLSASDMRELYAKHPETSFVVVCQTTKTGLFRGEKELEHDVDCVIRVNDLTAQAEKNRFGGSEVVKVF